VRLIEGRFQDKPRECLNCGDRWIVYEEKETDVNIAIAMVEDAARDAYDSAILISADSDLRPVVAVDGYMSIGHDKIRNAQLPPKIVAAGGVILERPAYWS
jgi:hypothetical protein